MIPKKVHALFIFIDYLDDHKAEYMEKYLPLCNEVIELDNQRWQLKPTYRYSDKLKYDELQKKIVEKTQPIYDNICIPTLNKLRELDIWSGDDVYTSIWNNNIAAIFELRENFTPDDVTEVKSYKQKYLGFRSETKSDFLCLQIVLSNLDDILKYLFEFFKDTDANEFDSFETKTISASSIEGAVKGLIQNRGRNISYSIPHQSLINPPTSSTQNTIIQSNNKVYTMAEVFLSYSWDSDKHKEDVLAFADLLRKRGYDTELDRTISQKQTATDFTQMMHEAILNHPKVIVILSSGYKEKADKFMGGAGKEYGLLLNDIDDNPRKYILVSFGKRNDDLTPFGLKGRDIVDVTTPAGLTSLDHKIQDIDEVILSPVGASKPVLTTAVPKAFPVSATIDCPIEIVGMRVRQDGSGAAGGIYNSIEYTIAFDYRNISSNTVNSFDYEIRMNRFLDANVLANQRDGDNTLIQESIIKPTYKGQTKTTSGFPIKIASYNIRQILGTQIRLKIYTEDGETEKTFNVEDEIKVDPNRIGAYPDKTDLRTAFDIK